MNRRTIRVSLRTLETLINDYEHCAQEEGGVVDRWRQALIRRLRRMIARAKEKVSQ